MPIDSTADLLFRIGANSDDAEANVKRFRTILSTDLAEMGAQFSTWAEETFGKLNSAAAIGTAGAAALAAAIVAGAGAAVEAGRKYAEYVEQIDHASKVSGIGVEEMSKLRFAAVSTGGSFESLVPGLMRFSTAVVKGAEGSKQSAEAFARLGITQRELQAGEHNVLPLLMEVADKFKGLSSNTMRAAEARELFGRGGGAFLELLAQGSDGLKRMAQQAEEMGLVITDKDVVAMHEYKAASAVMRAELQAMAITVGREVLPMMTNMAAAIAAIGEEVTSGHLMRDMARGEFGAAVALNFGVAKVHIEEFAKALEHLGNEDLAPAAAKKVKDNFTGISDVLERLNTELAGFGSEEGQAEEKIQRLVSETGKALDELKRKKAEAEKKGVALEGYERELAAWEEIAQKLPLLYDELMHKIGQQRIRAGNEAEAELRGRIAREQELQRAAKEAELNEEVNAQERKYRADKNIDDQERPRLLELAEQWRAAGLAKMRADWAKEDAANEERLQKEVLGEANSVEAKHRLVDLDVNYQEAAIKATGDAYVREFLLEEQLRAARHAKIDADAKAAFDSEMARLGEQRKAIEREYSTSAERIREQYAADVAKCDAAAEREAKKGRSPEDQAAIAAQFAAMRAALGTRMAGELQQLTDSKGWQGVFGAPFQATIRENQALMKQWATGTSQSALLVQASLKGLEGIGKKAFDQLAQGMGANIAHAIIYSSSIGKAMKAALAATLESIAAQSMVQAIYATALGFLDLAEQDYEGAGAAFTAAAIFGSVGAAAAVAGRALVGPQGGAGGAGAGSGSGGGPGVGQFGSDAAARQKNDAAGYQPGATAAGAGGLHITVNVQGHLVGWNNLNELTSAINDSVMNKGTTLTATNTKTGQQLIR